MKIARLKTLHKTVEEYLKENDKDVAFTVSNYCSGNRETEYILKLMDIETGEMIGELDIPSETV